MCIKSTEWHPLLLLWFIWLGLGIPFLSDAAARGHPGLILGQLLVPFQTKTLASSLSPKNIAGVKKVIIILVIRLPIVGHIRQINKMHS